MKTTHLLIVGLAAAIGIAAHAQSNLTQENLQTQPFNSSFWNAYANKLQLNLKEKQEFLSSQKLAALSGNKGIQNPIQKVIYNPKNTASSSVGCNNIDFENGNFNGWIPSSGYHPLFNPLGCCPTSGGQQTIMSGTTSDPFGGFPVVCPGGNFSLRLGSSQIGGHADRIQQTFFVTPLNANFTYKYAVVLEDPGHPANAQPSFQVQMLDSLGNQIPCTYYNVSAGQNIPGFQNSTAQAGVIYKPWTSVVVDLTSYIGQNVTIQFTAYDCGYGGHFGYAYIDGNCAAFTSGSQSSVCVGASTSFCAPAGFGAYVWNGPGTSNLNSQCINVTSAGVYTCQTVLVTGCQGPAFTYTLINYPLPIVSFTQNSANACSLQYNFVNTSTINAGSISSYTWSFGNNQNLNTTNASHSYTQSGIYTVTLTGTSNFGCINATINTFTISPTPVANFSTQSVCQNNTSNFTDLSLGSISSYTWNFSNLSSSNISSPSFLFPSSGSFNVILGVTSNMGCTSTTNAVVVVYPLPTLSISAANNCLGIPTQFNNSSSIASGSIVNWIWNFTGNLAPQSNAQNPSYTYTLPGTYSIALQGISNFNCISSTTLNVQVYALPNALFALNNTCFGTVSSFTNQSAIAAGSSINSYNWNFNNVANSTQVNPSYQFQNPGVYNVNLTVTSNFGCNSTVSHSLVIYNLPNTNFSNNTACFNQATQFNNSTVISGGTIIKWRWDYNNDGIWDDTLSANPSYIYPNYGNYTCKLQSISNNNCSSFKLNPVLIHNNPIAKFYTSSTCLGDVTSFSNTSISNDGLITSTQWDFYGSGNINNISYNASNTYSNYGVFPVKLEVQTQYGCTNTFVKPVYVNPKPLANFITNNAQGCPNLCVSFTNSSTIPKGQIVTTQWMFGDGTQPSYQQNPMHCYGTGTYNVTLKLVSDSACITTLSKPNFINVYPLPIANFIVSPEEVDEDLPSIEVSSTAQGAATTSYYITDGSSYNTPNFTALINPSGNTAPAIFQVVKNQYGCSDTASQIIKFKPTFVIYIPNTFTPNGDGVNDSFFAKGVGIEKFNIKIYDRWGHLIFEGNSIDDYWDGKAKNSDEVIKEDVYTWKVEVVDVFKKFHDLTGHVSVIK